jgi:hypothetical protein
MKVWFGYGSEHSAKLVIIGTFKSNEDASVAARLIEEASEIALREHEAGRLSKETFSPEMLQLISNHSLGFNYADPEQLIYEFNAHQEGSKVIIKTDETDIQAFLKIFIRYGARVEMFSTHDYPSEYNR